MNTEPHVKGNWKRVKRYWQFGMTLLFIVVAVALKKDDLFSAITDFSQNNIPIPQLSFLLLVASIVLVLRWYQAVDSEYQFLEDYLENYFTILPKHSFVIISGLGVLGGLLIYFTYDLLYFTCIFVCFKLFEIWGIYARDMTIKKALNLARNGSILEDTRKPIWDIVDKYYLNKPLTPLSISVMFFAFISLILSILATTLNNNPSVTWLMSTGYIIMFLDILVPEFIYSRWRRERNRLISVDY